MIKKQRGVRKREEAVDKPVNIWFVVRRKQGIIIVTVNVIRKWVSVQTLILAVRVSLWCITFKATNINKFFLGCQPRQVVNNYRRFRGYPDDGERDGPETSVILNQLTRLTARKVLLSLASLNFFYYGVLHWRISIKKTLNLTDRISITSVYTISKSRDSSAV
jgi:hypothetical protein